MISLFQLGDFNFYRVRADLMGPSTRDHQSGKYPTYFSLHNLFPVNVRVQQSYSDKVNTTVCVTSSMRDNFVPLKEMRHTTATGENATCSYVKNKVDKNVVAF